MKCMLAVLLPGLLFLFSCSCSENSKKTDSTEQTVAVQEIKANWKDTVALVTLFNKYILDNSFAVGRDFCILDDAASKKRFFYKINNVSFDSLFVTSNTSAVLSVPAKGDKGDQLLIDYKFKWITPQAVPQNGAVVDATTPHFELVDLEVRRINNEIRYLWQKNGEFWEKTAGNATPLVQ